MVPKVLKLFIAIFVLGKVDGGAYELYITHDVRLFRVDAINRDRKWRVWVVAHLFT